MYHSRANLWERKLPKALQVLRSRTNRATGKSPAEIILGHNLLCPGEWKTKWAQQRRARTPRERRQVNSEVLVRQVDFQQKEYHNLRAPPLTFNPGDKVNVRNFVPGAFAPAWTGPYEVVARTSDTTYEILINNHKSNIHLDDLRPARDGNPEVFEDESPYALSESSIEDPPAIDPVDSSQNKHDANDVPETVENPSPTPKKDQVENHDSLAAISRKDSVPIDINSFLSIPILPIEAQEACNQIIQIENEIARYIPKVLGFNGRPGDSQHLRLEEMLTREILKLDNVTNPGNSLVRSKRKAVVAMAEDLISRLENQRVTCCSS